MESVVRYRVSVLRLYSSSIPRLEMVAIDHSVTLLHPRWTCYCAYIINFFTEVSLQKSSFDRRAVCSFILVKLMAGTAPVVAAITDGSEQTAQSLDSKINLHHPSPQHCKAYFHHAYSPLIHTFCAYFQSAASDL